MSFTTTVINYLAPLAPLAALTPEQEVELNNLFDPAIRLLKDSIIPDYLPKMEKELLEFIRYVKSDCIHGDLEFADGQHIAEHLYDWIQTMIELDIRAAEVHTNAIQTYLSHSKVISKKCFSAVQVMEGLFAGAIGSIIYTILMSWLDKYTPYNLLMCIPLAGMSALILRAREASVFWHGFDRIIDNFNSFFSQMHRPVNNNSFAKNYYQLASKISHAIDSKETSEQLIVIIRQNIQNMKDEKIIKNDIFEGTFVRRLLDVPIGVTIDYRVTKTTLREYLKSQDRLEEVQEDVMAQVREIISSALEEESIRPDVSFTRLDNV